MFITLQFPLVDFRLLKANPDVVKKPSWPEPEDDDRMRYFGQVISRRKTYFGPWDDEKKYCDARNVINFCGLGKQNFFSALHQSESQSRILFRRFQSTGKFLSKFEVGFNDYSENYFKDLSRLEDRSEFRELINNSINAYLGCQVKVKIGNKLTDYVPLIASSKFLREAYYWATHSGERNFNFRRINDFISCGDPIVIAQVDSDRVDLSCLNSQMVRLPFLEQEGIRLYHYSLSLEVGRSHFNIKTWLIEVPKYENTLLLKGKDFSKYKFNETLRYLRINLLRIHCEKIALKKILGVIGNPSHEYLIKDEHTRDRIFFLLHKILLNLSNVTRNKQPQERLIEVAFRLDEEYYKTESLEDQIVGLNTAIEWLKKLNFKSEPLINFLTIMGDNYSNNSNSTFIVRSTIANSFNKVSKISSEEDAKLISDITDEVLKSGDKEAIENMQSFHEEIQKEEPKKSALKAFWASIATAIPTLLVNSDKVLTIIEKIGKVIHL